MKIIEIYLKTYPNIEESEVYSIQETIAEVLGLDKYDVTLILEDA